MKDAGRFDIGGTRIRRFLTKDRRRYWASVAVSTVLTFAAVAAGFQGQDALGSSVGLARQYFVAWVFFCLAYSSTTWWVMASMDATTLEQRLREDTRERERRRHSEAMYATGGPTGAVLLSAAALAAVLVVALRPELREDRTVVVLAVSVVVVTWLLLVMVYAVHYAREQINVGGLDFPGTDVASRSLTFVDFCYVAIQVSTGLQTADVSVRTTAMRREVMVHSVISFGFNTLVIALLVSQLTAVGS